MQSIKFIGIDLAKSVFQLALADSQHHVVKSLRLSRSQFKAYFTNHPPLHIIMETCGTAYYWARYFTSLGHQVSLLPAQYVKAYVRRNKTDHHDAVALIEAIRNHELHCVPVKSEYQQAQACTACAVSICVHEMHASIHYGEYCVNLGSLYQWVLQQHSAMPLKHCRNFLQSSRQHSVQ